MCIPFLALLTQLQLLCSYASLLGHTTSHQTGSIPLQNSLNSAIDGETIVKLLDQAASVLTLECMMAVWMIAVSTHYCNCLRFVQVRLDHTPPAVSTATTIRQAYTV